MGLRHRIVPPGHLVLALTAMAALLAHAAALALPPDGLATAPREMWIELSEPVATAGLAPQARAERIARIDAEQARFVAELHSLGIEELTRVRHARNAVLVIMSPEQAQAVSRLPGVRRVVPAAEQRPADTHATSTPHD